MYVFENVVYRYWLLLPIAYWIAYWIAINLLLDSQFAGTMSAATAAAVVFVLNHKPIGANKQ